MHEAGDYNNRMKLLNGERALVEDEKLLGYVLNQSHPVGRHHALLFQKLLGIGIVGNAYLLRQALESAAKNCDVWRVRQTPYGDKYEMRLELAGPGGRRMVRAVWIKESNQHTPRLVTCFVE